MAQRILPNYQDDLGSFEHSRQFAGILPAGRYCGFDTIDATGLNFGILHDVTGFFETLVDGSVSGNKMGALVTRQGMRVHETSDIGGLSCASNASNPFERIDLVIAEHLYADGAPGGTPLIYSVLQGANGGPVAPALPSPEKQFIIGAISIPANASNLSGATYTRAQTPLLGGLSLFDNFPELAQTFAKLGAVNYFTKTQALGKGDVTAANVSSGKYIVSSEGNLQSYTGASQTIREISDYTQEGVTIRIHNNDTTNSLTFQMEQSPLGGGLTIKKKWDTLPVILTPGHWIELVKEGSAWWVTASSVFLKEIADLRIEATRNNQVGSVKMFSGSTAGKFDGTGLGINEWTGWALMNGANGTDDARGRFMVGYDPRLSDPANNIWDSAYNNIGATGGEKAHVLDMTEMPTHSHSLDAVINGSDGTKNTVTIRNSPTDANAGGAEDGNTPASTYRTGSQGASAAHENRPPYYVIAFVKKIA